MFRVTLVLLCGLFLLPISAQSSDDVQARIFQYFLTKANDGDANAEFIVGNRYESGNGVPQDVNKAYMWYQKAAAKGNQPAQDKLNERKHAAEQVQKSKEEVVKEREQAARAEAERAARARRDAERAARARVRAIAQAERAAKAASAARLARNVTSVVPMREQPESPVDAMKILLSGKWFQGQSAAEYLPSASTSCLRASGSQIVCFSEQLSREIGDSALTYTVKSTLSNFNRNGSFTVNYMYDVMDIGKSRSGYAANSANDGSNLAARLGWQQPGQTLQCKASDDRTLVCTTQQKRLLQYTKR